MKKTIFEWKVQEVIDLLGYTDKKMIKRLKPIIRKRLKEGLYITQVISYIGHMIK